MSYFERHMAPVSAKPSSRAPLFDSSTKRAYCGLIGGEIVCQPSHTCRNFFSSRESRMKSVILLISRQVSGLFGSEHHLPFPYSPSMSEAIFVNSSPSLGSDGVAITSDTFSKL